MIFFLIDIVCLEVAFFMSMVLKLGKISYLSPIMREYYIRLAIVLMLLDICIVFLFEPYTGILRRNRVQELRAVVMHCTTVFVGITVYLWGTKQAEIYSRQVIMVFWGISIPFAYFSRCLWKIYIRQKMIRGKRFSKMIVVTEDKYAQECVREFRNDRYKEFEVTAVIVVDRDRAAKRFVVYRLWQTRVPVWNM